MSDKILSAEEIQGLRDFARQGHVMPPPGQYLVLNSHEALRAERDAAREALRKIRDGIENDLRGPGAWAIGIASAALPDSVKTDP